MKLLSAVAAVLVLLGFSAAPSAQAIMEPTPGSQIYFVTSMQTSTGIGMSPHYCGGVVIGSQWIMTVRSCAEGRPIEQIAIRAGSRRVGGEGQLVAVSKVVPHPTGDAVLIRLSERVDTVPARLADEPSPAGTWAKVLGYGQTCPEPGCGGPSAELQEVDSVVEPGAVCGVGRDQVCARFPNNGGPCFGDEGGPMVTKVADGWRVVGLVPSRPSVAQACGRGLSSVVEVSQFREWVRETAGV
jgi:trypsin